ncbi:MAG TPA: metalloregulator ArsR/SmtB family transcription factor [Candidatus Acidoferrales bacterium]|nr:metalloregulator ArsR/SmtB family transcription factor [Candidatus Acidoferrales bacterium]
MRYSFQAEFFKALSHPLRIRVLEALRQGPVSVNELRERLGVEQSTLSQQLAVLRSRRLVVTQRRGTTIRYQISDPAIWRLLDSAREIFENQLVSVQTEIEDLRQASRQAG